MKRVFKFAMPFLQASLVKQILVGLILGMALGLTFPDAAKSVGFLGTVFVMALKGVAPILVFVLVMSSIANQSDISQGNMHVKPIIVLYLVGTFLAAVIAVGASFLWPTEITLQAAQDTVATPGGIAEVFGNLILQAVDNPVHAIASGNYISILVWAIAMGAVLRQSHSSTREVLLDAAKTVEFIVRLVIRFAPFGIFGIVASTLATTGLEVFAGYLKLLAVLVGTMFFIALVVNPILVWLMIRRNPYPYTLMTLRESGVAAFFTRSSAANIPVNLEICRRLNLPESTYYEDMMEPESTYSISIPVGATVNMQGAAITITVLTLAAAFSLDVQVSTATAIFLSFVAALCACGASGVPGGSLMLIPLAGGLFGIDQNTAMQVVAVGFIIGVVQDSCETALNSSADALFTIAACKRADRLAGKDISD